MITKEVWDRCIPGHVMTRRGRTPVTMVRSRKVADVSNELVFTIGGKRIHLYYPVVEGGLLTWGAQEYVGITKYLRPVVTNVGVGRRRRVTIHGYGSSVEVMVLPRTSSPSCRWGTRFYYQGVPSSAAAAFQRFPLRPVDREWMDQVLGVPGPHHVTMADLQACYDLFGTTTEWEWKALCDMRCMGVEESYLYYLMDLLQWMSYANVDSDTIRRRMDRFWTGNPQVQWLDPGISDLARVAMMQKVHLPIGHFDPLEDILPHSSWVGVLDLLTTPQSELAGTVVSYTDRR